MTELIKDRDSFWVAYDPKQQTAIEIWSVDGTMVAETSWGELYTAEQANEILKTVVDADRVIMRKVGDQPTPVESIIEQEQTTR